MGKWKICLALLLALCLPISAEASYTSELYDFYGFQHDVEVAPEVLETIRKYNNAKRFVRTYGNLAYLVIDQDSIDTTTDGYLKHLQEIESQLDKGYHLSFYEISELEADYVVTKRKLESHLSRTSTGASIDIDVVSNAPTKEEYDAAVALRNEALVRSELGSLSFSEVPISGKALLRYADDDYSSYATSNHAQVKALFNGVVTNIYEHEFFETCIDIDCSNGVTYTIGHITDCTVTVGQPVSQFQNIGFTQGNTVVYRLCLNGEFVCVNKLFVGESEE